MAGDRLYLHCYVYRLIVGQKERIDNKTVIGKNYHKGMQQELRKKGARMGAVFLFLIRGISFKHFIRCTSTYTAGGKT
jgi:hypothetical protein